jgi:serine protease inhibitor
VFKQANNQQLPFYNAERDAKTVAFMVRDDEDLFYYEDEKVQVLDLPYMSAKWYARVVLPKKSLAKEGRSLGVQATLLTFPNIRQNCFGCVVN